MNYGEMAEWPMAQSWKGCVGATLPWVRIPLSPPNEFPPSPFAILDFTLNFLLCIFYQPKFNSPSNVVALKLALNTNVFILFTIGSFYLS